MHDDDEDEDDVRSTPAAPERVRARKLTKRASLPSFDGALDAFVARANDAPVDVSDFDGDRREQVLRDELVAARARVTDLERRSSRRWVGIALAFALGAGTMVAVDRVRDESRPAVAAPAVPASPPVLAAPAGCPSPREPAGPLAAPAGCPAPRETASQLAVTPTPPRGPDNDPVPAAPASTATPAATPVPSASTQRPAPRRSSRAASPAPSASTSPTPPSPSSGEPASPASAGSGSGALYNPF